MEQLSSSKNLSTSDFGRPFNPKAKFSNFTTFLPPNSLISPPPECLHNALHLGKTDTAAELELIAVQCFQAVTVGLVHLVQLFQFANLLTHVHGNNVLDHDQVGRHLTVLHALATDVIQQQHTRLVASQQLVLSCLVLDGDTNTVTVRINSQQPVGVTLLGILHAQCHSLFDLQIGIQAGWEVSVRHPVHTTFQSCQVTRFRTPVRMRQLDAPVSTGFSWH